MGGALSALNDALFGAPPTAPDFQKLADQQMRAGRPDQSTPFGFSNWTQDANGNWTQSTGFSPQMQGLFDTAAGQAQQGLARGIGTGDDAFRQSFGAAWDNAQHNLLPQLQSHFDQGRSSLINSGAVGAGLNNGMQDLDQRYSAGLAGAWDTAMGAGRAGQAQTYAQNRDAYAAPFSLLGSMQNMMQMPSFQTAGNFQTAGQQQYNADLGAYNAQQQGITGLLQGAGDVAAAAYGMPSGSPGGAPGGTPFSFGGTSGAQGNPWNFQLDPGNLFQPQGR
jgi:hypothetical protein